MRERNAVEQKFRGVDEFNNLQLSSAFQAIFSLAHRKPVGHEALLRAKTVRGDVVSPLDVFALAQTDADITGLDRLCRTLHVRNYQALGLEQGWLFLNVNPTVVIHGRSYGAFFSGLLEAHGMPAHRVVVEILEGKIHDEGQLAEAVAYYRDLGCLVAIDDFGAGHSNFERIWRLSPDIVKLDRSVIVHAASNRKARRVLPGLVSLLHETGCLVLTEGVETEDEALLSMDADVDLVQGYFFARPDANPGSPVANKCPLTDLCERFKHMVATESETWAARAAPRMTSLERSAAAIETGLSIETACADLIAVEGVERCYLLDAMGAQIGTNLVSPALAVAADPRFAPLEDASSARWFRRPYFRRAIADPGRVRISRPYLSLTGAHMCVTLSIAFLRSGGTQVLCCDLNMDALEDG